MMWKSKRPSHDHAPGSIASGAIHQQSGIGLVRVCPHGCSTIVGSSMRVSMPPESKVLTATTRPARRLMPRRIGREDPLQVLEQAL
jgi:hypothetical protein